MSIAISIARMQQYAATPVSSGRLGEAEGLAFAIVLCVAGFYTLALAVNLLQCTAFAGGDAVLRSPLQPGAQERRPYRTSLSEAAPAPSAARRLGRRRPARLSMAAFFLFAIIFFWTPPHFWALALLRRKDYARRRIPMLPVVRWRPRSALADPALLHPAGRPDAAASAGRRTAAPCSWSRRRLFGVWA